MCERSIQEYFEQADREEEIGPIREWLAWSFWLGMGVAAALGIYIGILKCIFGDGAQITYIIHF